MLYHLNTSSIEAISTGNSFHKYSPNVPVMPFSFCFSIAIPNPEKTMYLNIQFRFVRLGSKPILPCVTVITMQDRRKRAELMISATIRNGFWVHTKPPFDLFQRCPPLPHYLMKPDLEPFLDPSTDERWMRWWGVPFSGSDYTGSVLSVKDKANPKTNLRLTVVHKKNKVKFNWLSLQTVTTDNQNSLVDMAYFNEKKAAP